MKKFKIEIEVTTPDQMELAIPEEPVSTEELGEIVYSKVIELDVVKSIDSIKVEEL